MNTKHRGLIVLAFALPWLVVLMVPSLRNVLYVQALGSHVAPSLPWAERFDAAWNVERLAERFPNDVRVLALNAEEIDYGTTRDLIKNPKLAWSAYYVKYTYNGRIAASYDRLMRRFPREAWLVAKRLRHTMRWLRSDRVSTEGDIWDRKKALAAKAGPMPQLSPFEKSLHARQVQETIAAARRGAGVALTPATASSI